MVCREGKALQLSRDHTADQEDERARVEAAGGHVTRFGGHWRIGSAGIQVTRSGPCEGLPWKSAVVVPI